ncbi:MAG: hypothetical protein RXR08_12075 [Sulfolobaceae archaeon]
MPDIVIYFVRLQDIENVGLCPRIHFYHPIQRVFTFYEEYYVEVTVRSIPTGGPTTDEKNRRGGVEFD